VVNLVTGGWRNSADRQIAWIRTNTARLVSGRTSQHPSRTTSAASRGTPLTVRSRRDLLSALPPFAYPGSRLRSEHRVAFSPDKNDFIDLYKDKVAVEMEWSRFEMFFERGGQIVIQMLEELSDEKSYGA
jgi:hypothetical protein